MKNLILILIIGLLTIGLACSESDTIVNNDDSSEIINVDLPVDLNDLLGFYELPQDGSHDGNLLSPELDPPDLADTSYDVYSVTLIWGNRSSDHTMAEMPPMDWSGTLGVNGVAWVLPVKTILFEPDEDFLLDNPSEAQAAWKSITHGGFDGISFLIFLKRGITYTTAPMLSFDTEPLNQVWDFEDLKHLNAYYQTDAGAGLGIHAHLIKRFHCPKGLMGGQWIKSDTLPHSGHFEGLWLEVNSQPAGYYSGRFWMGDDGIGRYAGSVSGYVTDQVIAEFEGEWMYNDPSLCPTCGENMGLFKGRIKWLEQDLSGEMWGSFGDFNTTFGHDRLPMAGFWRANCDGPDASLID